MLLKRTNDATYITFDLKIIYEYYAKNKEKKENLNHILFESSRETHHF